MGGGVAIDLIHEWDYLSWLFGRPETVYCIKGIFSGLEIDSEDLAIYVAQRQNFSYELHLDYFGRKTIRELQIFMPEETVEADIANGQVRFLRSGKTINCKEDRNEYQAREIELILLTAIALSQLICFLTYCKTALYRRGQAT